MDARFAFLIRILTWLGAALPAESQRNFVVPWSTSKYGPDGPWQAVKITVGGNDSSQFVTAQAHADIDVYPGGEWVSLTLMNQACASYPDSMCGSGGTWRPSEEDVANRGIISWPYTYVDDSYGIAVREAQIIYLGLTINDKTVWNASLASAWNASTTNVTYPNGVVGGVPLGHLSLGGEDPFQTFSLSSTARDSNLTTWLFPGRLYNDGDIPSYSYGLHIGSAAFEYPGSLVFGGYNKGRIIGPMTSFSNSSAVDLLDIGIGVEFGESPFGFDKKENLLSTGPTKARPDPLAPYLSLPSKTCEALASILPVTFDKSLKYYIWNTDDPQFTKLVTSPAYLSFTFPPLPGDTDNVSIKVPFALLNLTLDIPITSKPTQYFPCHPYDVDGSIPVLGRAFLQAAFIGRNWNTATSWLAQAPGPGVSGLGLGDQYLDIPDGATTVEAFTGLDLFNQSWSGHWSIIASRELNRTTPGKGTGASASSKGLSTGVKAGIGVVVPFGVLALLATSLFLWRKRMASEQNDSDMDGLPELQPDYHAVARDGSPEKYHVVGVPPSSPQEIPGNDSPVEIPDSNNPKLR